MKIGRLLLGLGTCGLLLCATASLIYAEGDKEGAGSAKKEVVIIYGSGDFAMLDTQRHSSGVLASILGNIFDPLVERDKDGNWTGVLATSWKRLDDYTMEFKLRQGVKFQNGEPFDAEAVKFTVDRAIVPSRIAEHQYTAFKIIAGAEVVDQYTVRVKTKDPDPVLINKLGANQLRIVPPRYLKEKGDDYFATHPVGTGPYKFVSSSPDGDLIFEASDQFWGAKPSIQRVRWRIVPETGARVAELLAGTADVVVNVPYDQIQTLSANPKVSVRVSNSIRTPYLQLDNMVAPTDDKLVRQAIHYTLDLDTIIATLLKGNGRRIATYHIPEVAYFNPDLKPYPYDLQKAKQLLTQGGYANRLPLKMTFDCIIGRTPMDKEVVQAITGQLNASGLFDIKLVINEQGVFSEKESYTGMPRKVGQITIYSHGNGTLDPDFTLSRSFGLRPAPYNQLTSHQNDTHLDGLIKDAAKTMDENQRRQKYYRIQEYIHEKASRVFLYQQKDVWGCNPMLEWVPTSEYIDLKAMRWKQQG